MLKKKLPALYLWSNNGSILRLILIKIYDKKSHPITNFIITVLDELLCQVGARGQSHFADFLRFETVSVVRQNLLALLRARVG